MAYPQFTSDVSANIASSIPHQFYKEGQFIINRSTPLLSMSNFVRGTSNAAYWTVSDGGASFGYVGEGEQVNVNTEFNPDNVLTLSLPRGILRTGFAISETELAHVESLDSSITSAQVKQRLVNLWKGSYSALARGLEVQAAIGNGTAISIASGATVPGTYGWLYLLEQALANGSYAGQSLATHPALKINSVAVGGAISTAAMDEGFSAVLEQAGDVFDGTYFLMCSPRTEAALKATADSTVSLQGALRFNADSQEASYLLGARSTPGDRKARISYDGIPVLVNSAWSNRTSSSSANLDGYMLLASTKDYAVDAIPYSNKGLSPTEGMENAVQKFGRVTSEIGLPLYYRGYAELGGVFAAFASTELQFIWGAPNRMCVWTGITTT